MTKEEIAKITLYKFKEFARKKGIWEEYKKLSNPLNGRNGFNITKFIDIARVYEPVKLIQSSTIFCIWPNARPTYCAKRWWELSEEWAEICLSNHLFYDEIEAVDYVLYNIDLDIAAKYKKNKLKS